MKYLDYTPAADAEIWTLSDGEHEVSKHMTGALQALQQLPIEDCLKLIGMSDVAVVKYYAKVTDRMHRKVQDILATNWIWTETGEPVKIDDDFIEDFMPVDIVRDTLVRKLRERRMTGADLAAIIDFFENTNEIKAS